MNVAGYPAVVSVYCVLSFTRITLVLFFFLLKSRGIFPRQISIASCSDEQSTFEGPKGLSVTQVSGMYVPTHGMPSLMFIDSIDADRDLECV